MAGTNVHPVKVAIVTNQRLVRDALGHLLRHRGCFELAADTDMETLEGDIFIVDGQAIQADLDLLAKVRSRSGERPVLVIVDSADSTPISAFVDAGIAGLLDWSCSGEYLRETLSRIYQGETVFAVSLGRQLSPVQSHIRVDLTRRERQVICELATGKSNIAIARALGVTENTIKGHLVNIFEKLGADNRVQVTTFAIQNGLLRDSGGRSQPRSQVA